MPLPSSLTVDRVSALLHERFEIGGELGRGGQGVVFRARRIRTKTGDPTDDVVALKIHLDPGHDERIAREIRMMERVRHPSLATLLEHGTFESDGESLRFIAWDYIEGEPLSLHIARGPVSPGTVAVIGRDVATALVQIWGERVIHRDVNPKNIMLRSGAREAVLIDLGLARHLEESSITTSGFTWGTKGYMSPEQVRGERQLTCFSDVFALGVTMLEALTGRHPTRHRQDLIATTLLRATDLAPNAPAQLTQVIDRMLMPRAPFRPTPPALVKAFTALMPTL